MMCSCYSGVHSDLCHFGLGYGGEVWEDLHVEGGDKVGEVVSVEEEGVDQPQSQFLHTLQATLLQTPTSLLNTITLTHQATVWTQSNDSNGCTNIVKTLAATSSN